MHKEICPVSTTKKIIPLLAFILASALVAPAASQSPLTTLHAIRALPSSEADKGLPVAFNATVTYYDYNGGDLFVQDGNEAIYVEIKSDAGLAPGDRVLIRGNTRNSFGTDIVGEVARVLRHSTPPKPVAVGFAQLVSGESDCLRVTVHATVRSADTVSYGNIIRTYMKLHIDGGIIDATVLGSNPNDLKGLLDAEVDVTGAVSGLYDSKMQLTGILLEVPSMADVKILRRAQANPDSLPITPINKVLSAYFVHDMTRRVRVQGTITYYQPGSAIVLQDGANSLWISTHASDPMQIGDVAEATGFPDARYNFLALTDGEVYDARIFKPQLPQPSTWLQLATWNSGETEGHQSDLVSIEGQLVTVAREASQDEFVLSSDGRLLTAIYRHPPANGPLPPIRNIPQGSRVRVTGICMAVQTNAIDPIKVEVPFNILLRSFDDIAVIADPTWLNVRNLIYTIGLLVIVMLLAIGRGWSLERKVRRQTATLAAHTKAEAEMERRRSRILEDINGTEPLAGILERIAELVSFQLQDTPCWCEIANGPRLGRCPAETEGLRIVQKDIPARVGSPLGVIFAAFGPFAPPSSTEDEALLVGTRLATLAIETRRMNADLLHRSEYDLLTDIANRFSFERKLDNIIEEARQNAGVIGLIYIDLDDFKQVNDLYGHHTGDLYLQEIVSRMKRQLRTHDLLARLGGDEFAVLLPKVHSRAEIEEIAQRLKSCFNDPLVLGELTLQGSASFGIAAYPQDSATKDNLLSTADAAMYEAKNRKRKNN